jgi:hypothetical protein
VAVRHFARGQPLALRERPERGQRLVVGEHGIGLAADMAVQPLLQGCEIVVFEGGPGDVVLPALDEPRRRRRAAVGASRWLVAVRRGAPIRAGRRGGRRSGATAASCCGGASSANLRWYFSIAAAPANWASAPHCDVGMLPGQRLGEHVGFPCRQQVAHARAAASVRRRLQVRAG